MRLDYRRSSLDLNQDNNGCGNCNRCRRVHHDAQRAIVGICVERVNVRNLHHGQQRQQDQAHHGDDRQGT
jgi:hypothetical protein